MSGELTQTRRPSPSVSSDTSWSGSSSGYSDSGYSDGATMGTPPWMTDGPWSDGQAELDADLACYAPNPLDQVPVGDGLIDPRIDQSQEPEPPPEEQEPESDPELEEEAEQEEQESAEGGPGESEEEGGMSGGESEDALQSEAEDELPGGPEEGEESEGEGENTEEEGGLLAEGLGEEELGGGGGEDEPPGIEPPKPARLGGTDAVHIDEPPAMDARKSKRIQAESGISPHEHHARARARLTKISRTARRLQVRTVQKVEESADDVRIALMLRADQTPGVTAGAKGAVSGAASTGRGDLTKAAEDARARIVEAGGAVCTDVDEVALTAKAAIDAVLETSSQAIRDLHDEVMKPIRDLMKATAAEFKLTADYYSGLIRAQGQAFKDGFNQSTEDAITDAKNEKVAEIGPKLAEQKAGDIDTGGKQRGESVTSDPVDAQFSMIFLSIVNPAAVHTEEVGVEDEETQTSESRGSTMRLATAEERAEKTIATAMEQATAAIDQIEKQANESLDKMGVQIERAIRQQAMASDAGLRTAAPSYADAYRGQMRSLNAGFPPGRFHDWRQSEDRLDKAEDRIVGMGQEQSEALTERARDTLADGERAADEQHKSIRDSGNSQAGSITEQATEKVSMMVRAADSYEGGFFEGGAAVNSEAEQHQQEVEEKLGAQAEQVKTAMKGVEDNAGLNFGQQVTDFDTESSDRYEEWTAGIAASDYSAFGSLFQEPVQKIESDLRHRSNECAAAFGGDGDGTDEKRCHKALSPLTPTQGRGVSQAYREDHGRDLAYDIDDEMDGDDESAALNYLAGDPVKGLKFELDASVHWYGDEEERMEEATRRLSDDQLKQLKDVEGWQETRDRLTNNLDGTDLKVMEALVDRQNRAEADVLRLTDKINEAKRNNKEADVVDLVNNMGQQTMLDLYGDAGPPPGELERYRARMMQEHHNLQAGPDSQAPKVSDTEAAQEFITWTNRDVETVEAVGDTYQTVVHHMSDASQNAISAIVTEGPNSPIAKAAKLNFEVARTGGGEPSEVQRMRIISAAENPGLVAARKELAKETDPVKRKQLEERVKGLEAEQQRFVTEFARLQGAPADTLNNPALAQEFAATQMGQVFSLVDSTEGDALGRSIINNGEVDRVIALHMAVNQYGTHEELIDHALAGMTYDEVQQLRADYLAKYGKTLDDALGTFGEAGFGEELSGEDRQRVELALNGVEKTDRDRARGAFRRKYHQIEEGGWMASATLGDSVESQKLHESSDQLEQMLRDALPAGEPPFLENGEPNPLAFDESGRFKGNGDAFNSLTGKVNARAESYRNAVDSMESFITDIVAALGIILLIVLTPFTGGASAALAAAIFTGVAGIVVKSGMRGDRYGWEEAGVDMAVAALDIATAGIGAGKFANSSIIKGAIVRVVAGTISGAAQVAMQDKTWQNGIGEGLTKVALGGGKAGLVALVTEGVSAGVNAKLGAAMALKPGQVASTTLQRLGKALGEDGTEALINAVSGSLAGMASETTGILWEVGAGEFKGDWLDALGRIGKSGLREFITGLAQGYGDARYKRKTTAKLEQGMGKIIESGRPPTDAERNQLFKLASAIEPGLTRSKFNEAFDGQVAQMRTLRDQMLDVFPKEMHGTLDKLPANVLAELRGFVQQPGLTAADRLKMLKRLEQHMPGMDRRAMLGAMSSAAAEISHRDQIAHEKTRATRAAISEGLPPHLRGSLADVPVTAFEGLSPEGLKKLAALLSAEGPPSLADRAELLKLARKGDPEIDVSRFMFAVDGMMKVGQRARDTEKAVARAQKKALFESLPKAARGPLSALPEAGLRHVLALAESGRTGTPHERAALLAAAKKANPKLDEAAFFKALDGTVAAREQIKQAERSTRMEARAQRLKDIPAEHRGPLSALPPEGVALLRALMVRETPPTPHEKMELLRLARKDAPGIQPHELLNALQGAISTAHEARAATKAAVSEARGHLLRDVPKELRAALKDTPILILDAQSFAAFTGSHKGEAVTLIIGGEPHVVIKEGATPLSIREEGAHLMQTKDPEWRARLGKLDESKLADWPNLPLTEQLALYREKVAIEIDGQKRTLAGLESELAGVTNPREAAALREQIDRVKTTMDNLHRRQQEVGALGPDQIAAIGRGEMARPQYLDQPARLFAKANETHEERVNRIKEEVKQAKENNKVRDDKLKQEFDDRQRIKPETVMIDGVPIEVFSVRGVYEHLTLGAGFAGIANELTRGARGPNDLVIGGKNPWENAEAKLELGQGGEGGVDLPGTEEGFKFKDAVKNPNAPYAMATEHGDHVLLNRDKADIPVLDGKALKIEPRVAGSSWPASAANANARVLIQTADGKHVWIYVKSVDVAVGPGAGRVPGEYNPTKLKWGDVDAPVADALQEHIGKKALEKIPAAQLKELMESGALRFADQGLREDLVQAGKSVMIYGGGPTGAWAAAMATKLAGKVDWVTQARDIDAISRVPASEGGDILRSAVEKQLSGTPLTAEENARLTRFTFEEQKGNGKLPRNEAVGGAYHPETASKIDFGAVTNLVKVEYDATTKKFKIYFEHNMTHPLETDQLIFAIGQDATRPAGPVDLLGAYHGTLEPIYGPDGISVVGLKSPDGVLRVMGVAATAPAVREMVNPLFKHLLTNFDVQAQANPTKDSKGVVAGFFMAGRMIEGANKPHDGTVDSNKIPKETKIEAVDLTTFIRDFKTQHAAHFPADNSVPRLSELQIIQLTDTVLHGYTDVEKAAIREHRLKNPYDAPPLPVKVTNDQIAVQAYTEKFKADHGDLYAGLKLSGAQVDKLSNVALREVVSSLPADQRGGAMDLIRNYRLWREVHGADGIPVMTDAQLVDHFRTGGTLNALGHPITPPLPAGALRPPVMDKAAMLKTRAENDAVDDLFRTSPRSDANIEAMALKAGVTRGEWRGMDVYEKLHELGVLDQWKTMSWEDTVRALRNIKGRGDEVAFQKWLTDNQIKQAYDAGKRPSPFSGEMIPRPAPPGVDPNTAPPGWKPPPPHARNWKGAAVDALSPKDLKAAIDDLRFSNKPVDDALRKHFEAMTAITEAARTGNRPLTPDEQLKITKLLESLNLLRIDKNPLAKEAWEEARKRVFDADKNSDQGKLVERFQKAQAEAEALKLDLKKVQDLLATLDAADPKRLFPEAEQLRLEGELTKKRDAMADDAAEVYALTRSRFGELMQTTMLHVFQKHPTWFDVNNMTDLNFLYKPIPSYVEVHHVKYKAIFPESAVETWNLLLAIRNKVKGGDDQLHELMHRLSAGGHTDLFNTLIAQMVELLHRHFKDT